MEPGFIPSTWTGLLEPIPYGGISCSAYTGEDLGPAWTSLGRHCSLLMTDLIPFWEVDGVFGQGKVGAGAGGTEGAVDDI